jgi:hypothetical protein
VADSLYLRNDYHDTIMKLIADSNLLPQKKYTGTVTSLSSFKEYLKTYRKKLDVLSTENFINRLA